MLIIRLEITKFNKRSLFPLQTMAERAAQTIALLTNIIGPAAVWVIEERKENYGYLTVPNCGIVIPILVTM